MSGETCNFKTRLFGGFDRRDVIAYIEKLAAQRNKYQVSSKKLEDQMVELREKLTEAENEIAEANRRIVEINIAALTDAARTITELQDKYESVRSDMEVTATHIKGELIRVGDTLMLMSSVLNTAGQRFADLRLIVDKEKNDLLNSESADE